MDEQTFAAVAAGVEIGVPLRLAILMLRLATIRKRIIVPLGATTPLFVYWFFPGHFVTYYLSIDGPRHDAYLPPWVVAFPLWVTSLIISAGLLFLSRPKGLVGRYLLGTGAILCAYLLLFHILGPAYWTA